MIYLGWILLAIGLTLRGVTIYSLKGNLTWRVQRPNYIVKTGIYKYIRHPLYLCSMIDGAGLGLLVTHSYGITFLFLCLNFNWIIDRIDREENFLATCYGQDYVEYFKRTWMLIPRVF